MLRKDNPSQQLVYYQAGIGTYTVPAIATPLTAKVEKLIDTMEEREAILLSLQVDVKDHDTRIKQIEATLRAAEQKAAEQEERRKNVEEELRNLQASSAARLKR